MTMGPLTTATAFLFGTLWGSFFFTLALRFIDGSMDRSPREALMGRSRCPHCEKAVHPLGLVPILGYLLLRGKCAQCGGRISPAYPLAETGYGLLLAFFVSHFGINSHTAVLFLLAGLGISISIIDLKTMRIPDPLLLVFLGLTLYPLIISMEWKSHFMGLAVMAVFFLVILLIFPGSFGMGDLKYAALMGLLVGFEQSFVVLETALITGAITGIFYAKFSGKGLRSKMPFGPFLTLGMIVSMIYGQEIILMYYGWIK